MTRFLLFDIDQLVSEIISKVIDKFLRYICCYLIILIFEFYLFHSSVEFVFSFVFVICSQLFLTLFLSNYVISLWFFVLCTLRHLPFVPIKIWFEMGTISLFVAIIFERFSDHMIPNLIKQSSSAWSLFRRGVTLYKIGNHSDVFWILQG